MNINNINFKPLLKRARTQDEQAYRDLIDATKDYVYFFARTLLNNNEAAEDVSQEVYIKLFNNLNNIKNDDAFQGYLSTIVRNCANEYLRKNHKIDENGVDVNYVDYDEIQEYDLQDERIDTQPELLLNQNEKRKIVLSIIDSLPYEQKEVVMMYFFDEKKITDIATELNVSENTVKSRLTYAKAKIKTEVEDLSKKHDIKLYDLSAVVFFIILLKMYGKVMLRKMSQIIGSIFIRLGVNESTVVTIKQKSSFSDMFKNKTNKTTKQVVKEKVEPTITKTVSDTVSDEVVTKTVTGVATKTAMPIAAKIAIGVACLGLVVGGGVFATKKFGLFNKTEDGEAIIEEVENYDKAWAINPTLTYDDIYVNPGKYYLGQYVFGIHNNPYSIGLDAGAFVVQGGHYGLINGAGEEVVNPQYETFLRFNDGGMFSDKHGYGPCVNVYSDYSTTYYYDGCGVGGIVDEYEVYSNNGSISIEGSFFSMGNEYDNFVNKYGKFVIKASGQRSNIYGNVLIKDGTIVFFNNLLTSKEVYDYSSDIILFTDGNSNYAVNPEYYNENGDLIISGYEAGYGFYEGYAPVMKNGKWGYIDINNNVVVDFIFDKATEIYNGQAWVKYNGKIGKLNIIDMINNNIPFTDEILSAFNPEAGSVATQGDTNNNQTTNQDKGYLFRIRITEIGNNVKIRSTPTLTVGNDNKVGNVHTDEEYYVYEEKVTEGYTWYRIGDDKWMATDGTWATKID